MLDKKKLSRKEIDSLVKTKETAKIKDKILMMDQGVFDRLPKSKITVQCDGAGWHLVTPKVDCKQLILKTRRELLQIIVKGHMILCNDCYEIMTGN